MLPIQQRLVQSHNIRNDVQSTLLQCYFADYEQVFANWVEQRSCSNIIFSDFEQVFCLLCYLFIEYITISLFIHTMGISLYILCLK